MDINIIIGIITTIIFIIIIVINISSSSRVAIDRLDPDQDLANAIKIVAVATAVEGKTLVEESSTMRRRPKRS
jgi:hypothetical protein